MSALIDKNIQPIPSPEKSIAVCIVEDNEWLREDLVREIKRISGFRCVGSYHSAETILEKLPAERPDVIVMDIKLPGLSGIECVRRLKEIDSGFVILMLTAYEESEAIFAALKAGASGYLLKRSRPGEVLQAIADVYHGGSPMTPAVARRVIQLLTQPRKTDEPVEGLSPREQEILNLLSKGYAYKEIADNLSVSVNTVRMFIQRIYKKLHIHSRAELMTRFNKPQ